MYHVRAAITLEPLPICVFECTSKTTDLTAYLERSATTGPPTRDQCFLTSWEWEILSGDKYPPGEKPEMFHRRHFEIISESGATDVVSARMLQSKENRAKVAKGMAVIFDESAKDAIRVHLEGVCERLFPKPDSHFKTVLVMHRDTGTTFAGIYPELDSGHAITQIVTAIHENPQAEDGQKLRAVLCGNPEDIHGISSIRDFWKYLGSEKWSKETKRDIEALFLKIAFDKGYYSMAVGFRSGALDLYTFLGIPTVSISLRPLVGEARHKQLAKLEFYRWNIQYEQPRHVATRWFTPRRLGGRFMGSPYWDFDTTSPPSKEEKEKLHRDEVGPFTAYDLQIVSTGLKIAVTKYLAWKAKPFVSGPASNMIPVFDNSCSRGCFPSNVGENISPPVKDKRPAMKAYFEGQKALEERDFAGRVARLEHLQEPKELYDQSKAEMEGHWKSILSRL